MKKIQLKDAIFGPGCLSLEKIIENDKDVYGKHLKIPRIMTIMINKIFQKLNVNGIFEKNKDVTEYINNFNQTG